MISPYRNLNKKKKRSAKELKISDWKIVSWVAWGGSSILTERAIAVFGEKRLSYAVEDGLITISSLAEISHSGNIVEYKNKIELTQMGWRIYYTF